jgi:hypothetical protein
MNHCDWLSCGDMLLEFRFQLLDPFLHCVEFLQDLLRQLLIRRARLRIGGTCAVRSGTIWRLLTIQRSHKPSRKHCNEGHPGPSFRKLVFLTLRIHDYEFSSLPGWLKLCKVGPHVAGRQAHTFLQQSYQEPQQKYHCDDT